MIIIDWTALTRVETMVTLDSSTIQGTVTQREGSITTNFSTNQGQITDTTGSQHVFIIDTVMDTIRPPTMVAKTIDIDNMARSIETSEMMLTKQITSPGADNSDTTTSV